MSFVNPVREIHVEPTTVCQAECPMCPRTLQGYHLGRIPNKFLTLDAFQSLTDSIIEGLDKVLFCGTLGEPAACGDLLEMISWVLSRNPRCVIGLNSNGGIKDKQWWQDLASLIKGNIYSYVVFSIDGLEDTNHIYRRNVDWNKVIENAKAFIDAGGAAHWDMLVFKHNEHQVESAKQLAKELGFTFFRTKVSSRFREHDVELQPPTGHVVGSSRTAFSCEAQKTKSLYLSAEGKWYPCCYTHMSNEMSFDKSWGNPVDAVDSSTWNDLAESFNVIPRPICARSCGTTYNKGQWTGEWQLNV